MKPIIILLLASLTLWGCGGSNEGGQSADENPLTAKYDTTYRWKSEKIEMQVRQYPPLDSALIDFLPAIPQAYTSGVVKVKKDEVHFDYEFPNQSNTKWQDYSRVSYTYLFENPKRNDEASIAVTVHNNSKSFENFTNFSDPIYKSFPEYKGFKYKFDEGNRISIWLPPFVELYLTASVYDSTETQTGQSIPSGRYLTKNWKAIVDKMDLEKINKTFNSNPIQYSR